MAYDGVMASRIQAENQKNEKRYRSAGQTSGPARTNAAVDPVIANLMAPREKLGHTEMPAPFEINIT